MHGQSHLIRACYGIGIEGDELTVEAVVAHAREHICHPLTLCVEQSYAQYITLMERYVVGHYHCRQCLVIDFQTYIADNIRRARM